MKNEIALKVYEIDYSFIIKNYLDKKLWNKEWNLFIYKDYIFTLNLNCINVKNNSIVFDIKSNQKSKWDCYVWGDYENGTTIAYSLSNPNIEVLKKQINGAIFKLIQNAESVQVIDSEEYKELCSYVDVEKEQLEEIAIEFLDNENITNEDVRDAYIESYVLKNSKVKDQIRDYKREKMYTVIPDVYLVFLEITKDETRKLNVLSALDEMKALKVSEEVKEYMEQLETEEYQEELKDNLEGI